MTRDMHIEGGKVTLKPDYERDGIVMYHADCREVLPSLVGQFQAVVTDTPYGIDGGSGGDARDYAKGGYGASDWSDTPEYIASVCVPVVADCIATGVPVAVTPGNRCMTMYPPPRDVGCFWTPAACTHGPWGFTTFQPIFYYGKDWRAGKGALPSGKAVTEASEKNGHPCPKPLGAWRWLIEKVAPPGATVLDPFMGSGTSGVACVKTGRKFIGIEREKAYFDIAVQRIEKAFEDQGLFMGNH